MIERGENRIERSTRPKHTQAFLQCFLRIAHVLQDVIADNAVEAIRGQWQSFSNAAHKGRSDLTGGRKLAALRALSLRWFYPGYRSCTQLGVSDSAPAIAAAQAEKFLSGDRKQRKPFQKPARNFVVVFHLRPLEHFGIPP